MSYEIKVRARLEANKSKLRSFQDINIQRLGGDADPKTVEIELRRQIAVDEEILQHHC